MGKVFSSDLKKRRNDAGMTLQQTADAIGKTKDHLWRVEAGQSLPSLDMLVDLAQLFNGVHGSCRGVRFFFVPEGEFEEFVTSIQDGDELDNNPIPADAGLSLGDKAYRLSLEAQELQETVQDLARHIPAIIQGKDEGIERLVALIKEADDLTEWGLAFRRLVKDQWPEQYERARDIILGQLAQEFGVAAAV